MAKVTRVTASVNPKSFVGKCPKKFVFYGRITSNKKGTVRYKWIRSDNANAPVRTIIFKKPGTLTVKSTWTLGGAGKVYTHWKAVKILLPNQTTSNRAVFKLKCLPDGSGGSKHCGIKLKSLSHTSGYPGGTFKMYGVWGPTQGTKLPCINKGGQNKLIVVSWSNTTLLVKIPAGLAPGNYKAGVYCKPLSQGPTGSSGWKDFTVKRRTITPGKPFKPVLIKPGVIKPGIITRTCIDPAAVEIRFQIVR
ncbi:MAG: hypothetical protein GY940_20460, partial [bacterium]|nr:hypothetical protein [bacterium]